VFILLLAVVTVGERLTRRKTVGMGLATVGTLVVLAGQYDLAALTDGSLFGGVILLFSSFCWAAFTVFGKPLVRRYTALEAVTYATVLSVPLFGVLVPVELATRGIGLAAIPVTPAVVGAVLYLGVASTAAAWYCWYKGLEYADASTVAVFFFAQPVVGVLLGVAFLDEAVGLGFLAGGVLLALGVYLVNTAELAPTDPAETTPVESD
jgi:drug/metabolite transporter (DMT)-like permease